ncbi:DUF6300 family protein [Streptomyces longisporoflavus]|uniref:DUF6300 family protein n=1 Tax=Streptomyces longisporoflavus TaxID=28044 RepID=A0ABW7R3X5_9ACTN
MAVIWRYLLRSDGSFSRVANIDGILDHVTDDELAGTCHTDADGDDQPARPCSRCGTDLLPHGHGPLMTGVWMELCPVCDAHKPAARAFISWHRAPQLNAARLSRLFHDWEDVIMHAHGWARAPRTAPLPGPQARPGLTPPAGLSGTTGVVEGCMDVRDVAAALGFWT